VADRIQVEHLSKRYRLGERGNLRETLVRLGRPRPTGDNELWSLRDVSFSVEDGQSLGIIGRNGAGKSTILKVLMRITTPTEGVSRTRGRVAALLEVGTGFHPELTGRENVFLNAAILGMSRRETLARFDEIVDFAGTERFLDTPVKRYSSGMYLRLAFAVAAHLEPDILIVDEVLAVGDAEFQRKCLGRMSSAEAEGRTVVFVSHDLSSLSKLCSRAIWLEKGQVRDDGPSAQVVRDYLSSGYHPAGGGRALDGGSSAGRLTAVAVRNAAGADGPLLREDPLTVVVEFEMDEARVGLDVAIFITNKRGVRVLDETMSHNHDVRFGVGRYRVEVTIPPVLAHGEYTVGVWLGDSATNVHYEEAAASFTLLGDPARFRDRVLVLDASFSATALD
jgi:ABC-type polysaccharide/polyol phosphate transport system ATPase subunit